MKRAVLGVFLVLVGCSSMKRTHCPGEVTQPPPKEAARNIHSSTVALATKPCKMVQGRKVCAGDKPSEELRKPATSSAILESDLSRKKRHSEALQNNMKPHLDPIKPNGI